MKIVVDGATDVVVGVHVLGEDAGEMAQLLAIAIRLGAKKADFDDTIAVHPTSAEELVTMRVRTARHERMTVGPEAPDAMPMGEGVVARTRRSTSGAPLPSGRT